MPGPVATDPDDLALALELSDIADSITGERFGAADLKVETKPDLTPVTEADKAVEHAIRDRLAVVRPEDSVIGEEYGDSPGSGRRRWIIDPIDGTKNFVRGIPVWGTLIALQDDEQGVVAAVSAPALHRRWWAAKGVGAFVDDGRADGPRALSVSGVRELGDAQLLLGGIEGWEQVGRLDQLLALVRSCWRSRGYGDFWQYMLVAEGVAEIGLDPEVSVWDLAAPQLIVEEAGGRFTDLAGQATAAGGDAIASNGLVHDAALAFVGR
jgi:histidinol-phosphatase